MKKQILLLAFTLLLNTQIKSQTTLYDGDNVLIPQKLIIESKVVINKDKDVEKQNLELGINNIYCNNQLQTDLFKLIIENCFNQKINLYTTSSYYDYDFKDKELISKEDIKNILGYEIDTIKKADPNKKGKVKETYVEKFDTSKLYSMYFIEDWNLDRKNFTFQKNIIGYAPVIKYYTEWNTERPNYKKIFLAIDTISNKDEIYASNQRMVLVNKTEYEYFPYFDIYYTNNIDSTYKLYKNYENEVSNFNFHLSNYYSPFLNYINIQYFAKFLTEKAITENYPVYDFDTNKKLSIDELKSNMGYSIDTTIGIGGDGEKYYLAYINDIDYLDIKSFIFEEEWYLDVQTLRMQKKGYCNFTCKILL